MKNLFTIFIICAITVFLSPNPIKGDCRAICSFGSCCIGIGYCNDRDYTHTYAPAPSGYSSSCECSNGSPDCYWVFER